MEQVEKLRPLFLKMGLKLPSSTSQPRPGPASAQPTTGKAVGDRLRGPELLTERSWEFLTGLPRAAEINHFLLLGHQRKSHGPRNDRLRLRACSISPFSQPTLFSTVYLQGLPDTFVTSSYPVTVSSHKPAPRICSFLSKFHHNPALMMNSLTNLVHNPLWKMYRE